MADTDAAAAAAGPGEGHAEPRDEPAAAVDGGENPGDSLRESVEPAVIVEPRTERSEIRSWISYDWANASYATCAISGFLPNLLKNLADGAADERGYVSLAGIPIRPVSFATGSIVVSCLIQVVVFTLFGAAADFGSNRKTLLLLCAAAGALSTSALVFLSSDSLWWLAGLLLIVSNVAYGFSLVCFNAFLPLLVRNHPAVREAKGSASKREAFEKISNRVSTHGFAAHYLAGVLSLGLCVPILIAHQDNIKLGYRLCMLMCGIWWFAFSIGVVVWTRERPGPALPHGQSYIGATLRRVRNTAKEIRRLPHTLRLLVAYFVYSDGVSSIASLGSLFADEELGMKGLHLALLLIEVPLAAGIGNYFFLAVNQRLGVPPKRVIFINIGVLASLLFYALLGLIPSCPIGLKNVWEMYAFGFVFGFNLGSIQSFSRTLLAGLIPDGCEAEFFGFFEVTDKGSSLVVPSIATLIINLSGEIRLGMIPVLAAFLISVPVLRSVDLEAGHRHAKAASRYLREGDEEEGGAAGSAAGGGGAGGGGRGPRRATALV
eukprot:tig00021318_g20173.t1